MVRLDVVYKSFNPQLYNKFQFQYGTIGCLELLFFFGLYIVFQFQYGTIGCKTECKHHCERNSISIPVWYDWMSYTDFSMSPAPAFQFQYGTIGCVFFSMSKILLSRFQFQYGTIGCLVGTALAQANKLFQFQYGTIGCLVPTVSGNNLIDFNSSMVRLDV